MSNFKKLTGLAMASVLATGVVACAEKPFGAKPMAKGYDNAKTAEAKCGAHGKTTDGKCGEAKCGTHGKTTDGKCGEGKCGSK